jgi:hypothetical protein
MIDEIAFETDQSTDDELSEQIMDISIMNEKKDADRIQTQIDRGHKKVIGGLSMDPVIGIIFERPIFLHMKANQKSDEECGDRRGDIPDAEDVSE